MFGHQSPGSIWNRIGIQPKMLDQDPGQMNTDLKNRLYGTLLAFIAQTWVQSGQTVMKKLRRTLTNLEKINVLYECLKNGNTEQLLKCREKSSITLHREIYSKNCLNKNLFLLTFLSQLFNGKLYVRGSSRKRVTGNITDS
jgi:hypothetical protein